jgi:hypothetical protein
VRLEKGHINGVSDEVLDAVAREHCDSTRPSGFTCSTSPVPPGPGVPSGAVPGCACAPASSVSWSR